MLENPHNICFSSCGDHNAQSLCASYFGGIGSIGVCVKKEEKCKKPDHHLVSRVSP